MTLTVFVRLQADGMYRATAEENEYAEGKGGTIPEALESLASVIRHMANREAWRLFEKRK